MDKFVATPETAFRIGFILSLCLALTAGCKGTTTDAPDGDADGVAEVCSDVDGDDYGVGAGCLGADCDDSNPEVWAEDQCADVCAVDPHGTACPCDEQTDSEPDACYGGDPSTVGVGPCRLGLRFCRDGAWGECERQVTPTDEFCDDVDNDCDGDIDDGVLNECGTCADSCEVLSVGGTGGWGLDGANANGLIENAAGDLVLDGTTVSLHVIWIANSLEGSISKIDTRSRLEEGRYRTGPLGRSNDYWDGPGDNPSRTSVNYLGDAYVANRAFTGQATLAKFYYSGCPDKNRNGRVETSSGTDDMFDFGDDECLAWSTEVGRPSALMRSVAVEARAGLDGVVQEFAWAGMCNESTYYEVDGEDGELTGASANVAGCCTYGAAIDKDGILWSACLSDQVGTFDTSDPEGTARVFRMPSGQNYGITLDSEGNVWLGGGTPMRYRPEDDEWDVPPVGLNSLGIAVNRDGIVFTYEDSGTINIIDPRPERGEPDPTAWVIQTLRSRGGRGVAIDFDGLTWFVNRDAGNVTIMDPEAPEDMEEDCDTIDGSYTYSDMTGFQLRNATNPLGNYEHLFEGCPGDLVTEWTGIEWDATMPSSTRIDLEARSGQTLALLNAAPWVRVASDPPGPSPADLDEVDGLNQRNYLLQVRVTLYSDAREASPALHSLGAQRACLDPFE